MPTGNPTLAMEKTTCNAVFPWSYCISYVPSIYELIAPQFESTNALHITWSHVAVLASHFWATALSLLPSIPGTRHQRSSAPVGVAVSHDAPPPRVVWNPQLWVVAKPMGTEQSHDFASKLPNQIMFRFQQHQLWMAGSHSCYNTLCVRSANNRCIDPYSVQSGEYLCACVCISNMQEHIDKHIDKHIYIYTVDNRADTYAMHTNWICHVS